MPPPKWRPRARKVSHAQRTKPRASPTGGLSRGADRRLAPPTERPVARLLSFFSSSRALLGAKLACKCARRFRSGSGAAGPHARPISLLPASLLAALLGLERVLSLFLAAAAAVPGQRGLRLRAARLLPPSPKRSGEFHLPLSTYAKGQVSHLSHSHNRLHSRQLLILKLLPLVADSGSMRPKASTQADLTLARQSAERTFRPHKSRPTFPFFFFFFFFFFASFWPKTKSCLPASKQIEPSSRAPKVSRMEHSKDARLTQSSAPASSASLARSLTRSKAVQVEANLEIDEQLQGSGSWMLTLR